MLGFQWGAQVSQTENGVILAPYHPRLLLLLRSYLFCPFLRTKRLGTFTSVVSNFSKVVFLGSKNSVGLFDILVFWVFGTYTFILLLSGLSEKFIQLSRYELPACY